MALIAELITQLKVDSSSFVKGLKDSETSIVGFTEKLKVPLLAIAGIVTGVLGGAFYKLTSIVEESTHKIAALEEASKRLGVGVPELQRLQYAAQQAGISSESLNRSLGFLERNLSKAAQGNQTLTAALTELNLNAKDLLKLGVDKQYAAISEAIQKIQTPADQARLAMTLLGRGGITQLSLLKRNVGELTEEFKSFGGELTGPQAESVKKYAESINRLGAIWDAFKIQLTVAVAGPFKSLLDTLSKTIIQMGGVGTVARIAAGYLISGLQGAVSVFQTLLSNVDQAIIRFEQLERILLRINQVATLGLSNYVAGTGDKIAALTKDIEARQNAVASRSTTANRINQGLSGLQGQLAKGAAENQQAQKVQVTISAESGLKADVAESPQVTAKVLQLINKIAADNARTVGR